MKKQTLKEKFQQSIRLARTAEIWLGKQKAEEKLAKVLIVQARQYYAKKKGRGK